MEREDPPVSRSLPFGLRSATVALLAVVVAGTGGFVTRAQRVRSGDLPTRHRHASSGQPEVSHSGFGRVHAAGGQSRRDERRILVERPNGPGARRLHESRPRQRREERRGRLQRPGRGGPQKEPSDRDGRDRDDRDRDDDDHAVTVLEAAVHAAQRRQPDFSRAPKQARDLADRRDPPG